MARLFDDASVQYLTVTAVPVADLPLSMSCWFYTDDVGAGEFQSMFGIYDWSAGDGGRFFKLSFEPTDELRAVQRGPTAFRFAGVTPVSVDTWHHAGGTYTSDSDRDGYLDGSTTNNAEAAGAMTGIDRVIVGAAAKNSAADNFHSGGVAECALWNVVLTDAEMNVLAAGFSPLFVRPQNLLGYWPLIRSDQDIVGGNDLAPVASPTFTAHPPIIYPAPVPGPFIVTPIGGATVGRMYVVSAAVAGVTAAIDLIRISAPADAVVVVHKVVITQETEFGDAASEQMDIQFHRGSTDGSGGATPTARPLEVGDAAFGGTVATGNTSQSTEGTFLHHEAANVMAGFVWAATPEERIVLSPSGRLIVELPTAPDDSIDFRVFAAFEEIGG